MLHNYLSISPEVSEAMGKGLFDNGCEWLPR